MTFTPRWTAPAVNNKYYVGVGYGGYNKAIVIDSVTGSVLPNCVGYAYGRFMEESSTKTCNLPVSNANNWYRLATAYERGSKPRVGAVACWSGGTNGQGHVAIVEEVNGDTITVSESGYYSKIRFQLNTRTYPYNFNGLTFQGFIYNPNIEDRDMFKIPEGQFTTSYLGQKIIGYGQRSTQKVGMISAKGEYPHIALQDIKNIDNADITIYASMNANYFQMRDGQSDPYGEHYGTEYSFTNDFAPHKGNVLAYALLNNGNTICLPDNNFYYGRGECQFACAPAYVPYVNGARVDLWSTAFKATKSVATQQSMLIRTKDRFALAVCSGQATVDMLTEWAENNVEGLQDLCFMDSGGSTQILIGYDAPVYTGRQIPNVLAIYRAKDEQESPHEDVPVTDEKTAVIERLTAENERLNNMLDRIADILKERG